MPKKLKLQGSKPIISSEFTEETTDIKILNDLLRSVRVNSMMKNSIMFFKIGDIIENLNGPAIIYENLFCIFAINNTVLSIEEYVLNENVSNEFKIYYINNIDLFLEQRESNGYYKYMLYKTPNKYIINYLFNLNVIEKEKNEYGDAVVIS